MQSRLWINARQLRLQPTVPRVSCKAMSTFTLPNTHPEVTVNLTPDISKDQLLSFPAFKTWLSTLQHSLSQQSDNKHAFHTSPYSLRRIDIQAVDIFGQGRIGFVKFKAEVSNGNGEKLPGSVFLRGGSVGMLLILQPDDLEPDSESEKHVILTVQPRIPAGSLSFPELPAGMLDDGGTFAGGAAKEIYEETGLSISEDELFDLTALAHDSPQKTTGDDLPGEKLQKAVYPSPGGSDEFVPLFMCQKRMRRNQIHEMQGRLTGLRNEGEKITLKIVPLEDLWKDGLRDGKALAALALYQGLKREGRI